MANSGGGGQVPWWVIAGAMVLAVVATYIAAARPARAVTRVPIVAVAAARRGRSSIRRARLRRRPQLLQAFGIKASQVGSSADILTMRPGLSGLPKMQLTYGDYG